MCTTSISFKWLDILEKEFDKAFVNIDLLLSEFDVDELEIVQLIRKKLGTMCSCFSQLSHKALTIFQINCKAEAEIINLRSEIVDIKVQNDLLEREMHSLLIQLHSDQLERLNLTYSRQKDNIKNKLQKDLAQCSPIRSPFTEVEKKILTLENRKVRLQLENELLRSTIVSLQAEVCGARLAARYLDKELAGRIQQLQLLTREDMNIEIRNKLWDQLDAEILLQRHKTVIKVMRQQKSHSTPPDDVAGRVRNVYLNREPTKGLGISVTGGKEHGVPILISDLDPELFKKNLFVGDAILSVNGIDLNQLTHKDAVQILCSQLGDVTLTVITLSTVNMNEIEEETNIPSYLSYPFFEEPEIEHYMTNNKPPNTPTAPRTPASCSTESVKSSPEKSVKSSDECRSENELFGVSTLQNIFKNVSAIECSQNSNASVVGATVAVETNSSNALAITNDKSTESCCRSKVAAVEGCCKKDSIDSCRDDSVVVAAATAAAENRRRKDSITKSAVVSAIFNPSLPGDKSSHSVAVVSGIGDSTLGTPV